MHQFQRGMRQTAVSVFCSIRIIFTIIDCFVLFLFILDVRG